MIFPERVVGNELVLSIMDNAKITDVWAGEGKLTFSFTQGEEISDLHPVRVGAGYRGSTAYSVTDLKTLIDHTKQADAVKQGPQRSPCTGSAFFCPI